MPKQVKFQRRHCGFIADMLRDTVQLIEIQYDRIADRLSTTNPNFKRDRFIQRAKYGKEK